MSSNPPATMDDMLQELRKIRQSIGTPVRPQVPLDSYTERFVFATEPNDYDKIPTSKSKALKLEWTNETQDPLVFRDYFLRSDNSTAALYFLYLDIVVNGQSLIGIETNKNHVHANPSDDDHVQIDYYSLTSWGVSVDFYGGITPFQINKTIPPGKKIELLLWRKSINIAPANTSFVLNANLERYAPVSPNNYPTRTPTPRGYQDKTGYDYTTNGEYAGQNAK